MTEHTDEAMNQPQPGACHRHDDGRVCVRQRSGAWGIYVEVPSWGLPATGFCSRSHQPTRPGQGQR